MGGGGQEPESTRAPSSHASNARGGDQVQNMVADVAMMAATKRSVAHEAADEIAI